MDKKNNSAIDKNEKTKEGFLGASNKHTPSKSNPYPSIDENKAIEGTIEDEYESKGQDYLSEPVIKFAEELISVLEKLSRKIINQKNKVNDQEKKIKDIEKTIKNLRKQTKKTIKNSIKQTKKQKQYFNKRIKNSNKKIEHKIENTKTSVIESLALFAAFFTFVAVNVQIFTKVTNLRSAMWFSLLLLGCLGFFAVIVHLIILKREYKRISIVIGVLLIIFSIFISLGLIFGNEKLHKDETDNIKIENKGGDIQTHDNKVSAPKKVQ